jgi:Holliday junction resolvase RusA-like endonuclease
VIGDSDSEPEVQIINPNQNAVLDLSRFYGTIRLGPFSWQRPVHATTANGRHYVYNPSRPDQQTFNAAVTARLQPGWTPLTGPVEVLIDFVYADMDRRGQYGGPGDIDNLMKFVFDALNGLLYNDDVQICRVVATKRFGRMARTNLTVREL